MARAARPTSTTSQVKLFGSWLTPVGLELGWLWTWNSGAAFTEADIYRPTTHAIYYNHRFADGSYAVTGAESHPSCDQLDLRLRDAIGLGRGFGLDLFVDVFNVLDDQQAIRVEEKVCGLRS